MSVPPHPVFPMNTYGHDCYSLLDRGSPFPPPPTHLSFPFMFSSTSLTFPPQSVLTSPTRFLFLADLPLAEVTC